MPGRILSVVVMVMMMVVVVRTAKTSSSPQHYYEAESYKVVSIGVWSGSKGWGLEVRRSCYHHPQQQQQQQQQQQHTHRCERGDEEWTEVWGEKEEEEVSGEVEEKVEEGGSEGSSPQHTNPHHPKHTTTTPGLTLTVLNQYTAQPIFHKVFRVDKYWAHWSDLKWHLDRVSGGRLVVVAVSVTGIIGLRHAALTMAALGSVLATHLPPSAHWTWIFVKGGRTISETTITHAQLPNHAHTIIPLSDIPYPVTSCVNQSVMDKLCDKMVQDSVQRWQYCASHDAMGGLCDEMAPDPLPPPTPPPITHNTALATVPVIVTAGKRHQYLYHTLTTLLTTPGAIHHNVHVVLGDAPSSTTQLLRLLNLNFTSLPVEDHHNQHLDYNYKLFRYYRTVFTFIATTFPQAPAVIMLDEDVEVSPDFFSYFSQTLWLLNSDPTLYCINAHSATGLRLIAHDPSTVVRGSVQVQWGFALSLNFVREVVSKWPDNPPLNDTLFYDEWLYRHGSRGRECVFPEMSRTLHYGIGVNTDPWSTEQWYLTQPQVTQPNVALSDVAGLVWGTWHSHFTSILRHATPLTSSPCSSTFLPSVNISTNFVLYYKQEALPNGKPDYKNLYYAAKCLNAWGVSEQGLHEKVLTVRTSLLTTVYIVGSPYSPYGHLRPSYIRPWSYDQLTDEDEEEVVERIRILEIGEYKINNINVMSDYLINLLSHS